MFFQNSQKLPIAMIDKFQNGSIPDGSLSSYLIVLMSYNIWNLNPLLFWLAVSKQQLSACQSICLCTGLEFNQKVPVNFQKRAQHSQVLKISKYGEKNLSGIMIMNFMDWGKMIFSIKKSWKIAIRKNWIKYF